MPVKETVFRRLLPLASVLAVLAGCASNSAQAPAGAGQSSVINPERSSRGNPPFYEVFGERYYVLDSSDGFSEQGVASWYGRDFHGKPTSSGEAYDMYELTAAHKTLPIPTWVEVTNVANGRKVIVKVNDRGPFVDDRIIDLSLRAAQELDMIDAGTARVRVRALGAPASFGNEPSQMIADTAPQPQQRRGFSIISEAQADSVGAGDDVYHPNYAQVGAFSDRANAARLVEQLRDDGFGDSFMLTSGQGREQIHRVRIGPITDAAHFDRVRADLRAIGINEVRLVQGN